ncbi:amidohydrolase [Streptomyces varsoviensis]|nr:amidohydrolase [Streptomyces varsoviensis]
MQETPAPGVPVLPPATTLRETAAATLAPVLKLYLDLHAHPELSGQEERTAARFAAALTAAGWTATTGVGGHGVVGVLRNGEGPTVLLRTELDALPVREDTGLPYASEARAPGPDGVEVPVMHACGHDAHAAALTGAARVLAALRAEWAGTVVIVGQPAEETLSGARAMLADGLYDRFPRPDVALAQHVAPFPAGLVAHGTGPMTAASATVEATVHGRGGHAGMPHLAVNAAEIAALAVARMKARTPAGTVLTVGALHAGTRANVVPDRATLGITVRAADDAAVTAAVELVREALREECETAGSPRPPETEVTARAPGNVNDARYGALVRAAHAAELGERRVVGWPSSTASEDFPWYGRAGAEEGLYEGPAVPTVYWMTGGVGAEQWSRAGGAAEVPVGEKLASLPPNHSPRFAPEAVATLRGAVHAMAAGALACLGPGAP